MASHSHTPFTHKFTMHVHMLTQMQTGQSEPGREIDGGRSRGERGGVRGRPRMAPAQSTWAPRKLAMPPKIFMMPNVH